MKIYHFSDTHHMHLELRPPDLEGVEAMVFSGDESNQRDWWFNQEEFYNFADWYGDFPFFGSKIMVAGNHSSFIAKKSDEARRYLYTCGIIYLENEEVTISGVKFYGSPLSPTFGNWHFMKSRETINRDWANIPDDTQVLITHTPPKGVLDLSFQSNLEMCGCGALGKRIQKLQRLKAHLFGHIHDGRDVLNNGVLRRNGVTYSNGSCVRDGDFESGIINHGNIIEI